MTQYNHAFKDLADANSMHTALPNLLVLKNKIFLLVHKLPLRGQFARELSHHALIGRLIKRN